MNVLHIISSISRQGGGPSRSSQGLVAGLRAAGIDAWLMTLQNGELPWIDGVDKFINGGKFEDALVRVKPNLVHIHDNGTMVSWRESVYLPGSIGLSILHSFSYGLPVITHGNEQHQMPEFEAMKDGRTGVCFRENDLEDLIACCHRYLSNENNRLEMGQYCQKLAFSRYSIDQMVSNFCAAIETVKGISNG